MSRMRQQIARVTARSKQEKPHFYVTSEVDMTEAMALRQQINTVLAGEGVRVTVNDLIIKACADALKKHPKFNAFLDGDVIRPNDSVNIGIAMAVEEGLLMPAIMGCESLSLKELALASKDLADRAQNGALRPDEYTGGTFGISNLGMFDVSTFVAIIPAATDRNPRRGHRRQAPRRQRRRACDSPDHERHHLRRPPRSGRRRRRAISDRSQKRPRKPAELDSLDAMSSIGL